MHKLSNLPVTRYLRRLIDRLLFQEKKNERKINFLCYLATYLFSFQDDNIILNNFGSTLSLYKADVNITLMLLNECHLRIF